jgi:hypothetical protein
MVVNSAHWTVVTMVESMVARKVMHSVDWMAVYSVETKVDEMAE